MSRITDELSKYGCDMNTTLERFLGDEDFYEKCLIEMLDLVRLTKDLLLKKRLMII